MYSYKYTLNISSWSKSTEELLSSIINMDNINYAFNKSFLHENKIIFIIKGLKKNLDNLEIKLAKYFSNIQEIEYFTKTTTKLSFNSENIDLEDCHFSLIYRDKKSKYPLEDCIKYLKSGKIGLIKNTNGFYITAISTKTPVVKKVRELLNKPTKTLPLLSKKLYQASKFAIVGKKEEELLNSDIKPFVIVKKRNIHRLEKIKNIPVRSVSTINSYKLKFPKNNIEEYLVTELNLPFVFHKISDKQNLYDKVDFVLSFEKVFIEQNDSLLQIIYGKNQVIYAGLGYPQILVKLEENIKENFYYETDESIAVVNDNKIYLSPYKMQKRDFCMLMDIKHAKKVEHTTNNPIALTHYHESLFKKAVVFEFCSEKATVLLYDKNVSSVLYTFKFPPKKYFDECVLEKDLLKNVTYGKESQLVCDSLYEICYEDSFQYSINDNMIDIQISLKIDKKEICSNLLNTFTAIVVDIVNQHNLPVVLCGDLFENKNLAENIIEYFDENDIKYHISSTMPLNKSIEPLGILLDFCLKK